MRNEYTETLGSELTAAYKKSNKTLGQFLDYLVETRSEVIVGEPQIGITNIGTEEYSTYMFFALLESPEGDGHGVYTFYSNSRDNTWCCKM